MNDNTQAVISFTGVTKVFSLGILRKKTAVEDLTLSVPRGRVVGLLGPNGSGKSTTLKMMLGFLAPTRGEILVCGHPAGTREARNFIGYLPETPRFQKFLTGRQTLHYFGKLLNLDNAALHRRIPELLDLVYLSHAADERVQGYSKGMTQRLAIAQALLSAPPLLVFDEPMSGLDPLGRMEIRRLIARIHEEMPETTLFFSTHILADVEQLCSEVALLRRGRLAAYRPIAELVTENQERFDVMVHGLDEDLSARLVREKAARRGPIGLSLTIDGTDSLIQELSDLTEAGGRIVGISSHRQSLEEALFREGPSPVAPAPAEVSP